MAIQPLKQIGSQLELLNSTSYDAGPFFSPMTALDAYSAYFSGSILVDRGGHVISLTEVDTLCDYAKNKGTAGVMLWSTYKQAAPGTPSPNQISKQVCQDFGPSNCDTPLV